MPTIFVVVLCHTKQKTVHFYICKTRTDEYLALFPDNRLIILNNLSKLFQNC